MDGALVEKMFALGLMGIEIPEAYGGSGGIVLRCGAGCRDCCRRSIPRWRSLVDVHNTLVAERTCCCWANERPEAEIFAAAGGGHCGRVRTERGGIGDQMRLRCRRVPRSAAATMCSTGASFGFRTHKEAGLFIVFATVDASAGYKGITAFLIEKGAAGFTGAAKRTSWAFARGARVSLSWMVAGFRRRRCSARWVKDTSGHGDAERGAHRHWRANAGAGRGAWGHAVEICEDASSLARRLWISRRCSSSLPRWRPRLRLPS